MRPCKDISKRGGSRSQAPGLLMEVRTEISGKEAMSQLKVEDELESAG